MNVDLGFVSLVPFWVLDQKRGVWSNVGFDILDKKGTTRSIFYTINE
jgi:hypothetical protein